MSHMPNSRVATMEVVVTASRLVAQGIRQLHLARPDGAPLPAFTPGSHIDLHLGPGRVRPYSLCGPASDRSRYTIAVKREPTSRGGSLAVHETLTEGSRIGISMPRNNFATVPDASHTILVAGGIGITPLLSMAHALQTGGRSWELLYFCRSPAQAAFADLLRAPPFLGHCRIFLGLPREEVRGILVDALRFEMDRHAYLCGPAPFMSLVQEVAAADWPPEAVHLERFAADPAARPAGGDQAFTVLLPRSGMRIAVPAQVSLLDALLGAGIEADRSCEQGVCGTCVTPVLEGIPDHRDCFLTPAERQRGDCIALCVSRSRTPVLTLDL